MIHRLDKFQVIEHLGNGHFGHVYKCYDPFLEKEIAIKVIKTSNALKFEESVKEGQTLEKCRHKHIVDVKDVRSSFYEGYNVVIIVMEYLSHGSIQKHIEKRFISVKESCLIIQQSLLGLEHAHNNNILHRDIKPGNILFGDNKEAKLSDFGLAINYHDELSDVSGYMPHQPLEVLTGSPMDKQSDIYAMGITFYRLLNNTNELELDFASIDELIYAIKKKLFPSRTFLSHIPEKIIKLFEKSVHNNSGVRYQSCSEFRQALEKLSFNINWLLLDSDNWIGKDDSGNNYSLTKVKKRKGWTIDFKKNRIRKTEFCCVETPDHLVDEEFYKIIRKTTLF